LKKLLFLLALPSLALAGYIPTPEYSCSNIDLRNETLGEVRNQKDVSWCYAFTAADMLAHTFNLSHKISAADIALAYNDTRIGRFSRWLNVKLLARKDEEVRLSPHETGLNKAALITVMQKGHCPESTFSSEEWTKIERSDEGWISKKVDLKEAMLDIAHLHKNRTNLTVENLPYYFSFKNIEAADFLEIIKTSRLPKIYSKIREAVCRDDREKFDYNWKVKMVFRNPHVFRRLSEQLEYGRIVGIDYDSRILKDRKNQRVSLAELHTSSVVGRRWNSELKTCEYLIRNSYGNKCDDKYDPTYECHSGNVWLGESLIYPNMTSIVYMLSPVR
jgi:hypothetical protein